MFDKRGITFEVLAMIILLLVGFGIVLFAYTQINWTGNVDDEVCHQSVIYRGSLPVFGGAKDAIPLKCKTEKFCITAGLLGGDCDKDFHGAKGVTKVKVKNIDEVEQFLARDMIDCWTMMGEGEVGLFSQWVIDTYGVGGQVYPTCVICSRVAFDTDSLEDKKIYLKEMDLFDYMRKHKVSGTEVSYLEFMGMEEGKGVSVDLGSKSEFKLSLDGMDKNGEPKVEPKKISLTYAGSDEEVPSDLPYTDQEIAILFMQISAPTYSGTWKNIGRTLGVFALGAASTPGATYAVGKLACGGPIRGAVCGSLALIGGLYQIGNVAHNKAVSASYCGDITIGDEAREGCSVVRTTYYQPENIQEYCEVIESIP